jgi:hypothetical protein
MRKNRIKQSQPAAAACQQARSYLRWRVEESLLAAVGPVQAQWHPQP